MAGERDAVEVDPEALTSYQRAAGDIAEDLRSVGTSTLSGTSTLPDDCFGAIGVEVGLTEAFAAAVRSQLDGLTATADGVAALGRAVGGALTGYQRQDEDAAQAVSNAEYI